MKWLYSNINTSATSKTGIKWVQNDCTLPSLVQKKTEIKTWSLVEVRHVHHLMVGMGILELVKTRPKVNQNWLTPKPNHPWLQREMHIISWKLEMIHLVTWATRILNLTLCHHSSHIVPKPQNLQSTILILDKTIFSNIYVTEPSLL